MALFRSQPARSMRRVRWWFLRALGLTHFIAFSSLRRQVRGLYGERGIWPLKPVLHELSAELGRQRFTALPSLLWFGASDRALTRLCGAGQLLSLALAFNLAPRLACAGLWSAYASFTNVGGDFMSFQWDALLLESTLDAAIVAPGGLRPGLGKEEPTGVAVALMRGLCGRLYFESGTAKWQSGDPTWRSYGAVGHYYQTAPLPTRLGWRAHHLPARVQTLSTALSLAIEVGAPMLALGGPRARRVAFGLLTALQLAIHATGNYGFFNLLSTALHAWLLDDGRRPRGRSMPAWKRLFELAAAAPIIALAGAELLARFTRSPRLHRWMMAAVRSRLVSPYGLFSVMTIKRPEIVIEGSDDGVRWREYGFRYKPGEPTQAPRRVAPFHQPRLDWQMWFAALGPPPPWFMAFLVRLLEGSPEVLALMGKNPFPNAPPKYVRAVLYDYKMTDERTRRESGAWWTRRRLRTYVPMVSLSDEPGWAEQAWEPQAPPRA